MADGPATRAYAADTGGTFTDVVGADGRIAKVLSTPADPGAAVRAGVSELAGDDEPDRLAHGTTVATNALLERRGAVVTLVTTAGLEDVVEIGRQDRPSLYDPFADRPAPLVDRDHRVGVPGRLDASGIEVEPVDLAPLADLPADTEAVAVCLLHADLDPTHEETVAAALAAAGHDVTTSSSVSPEMREAERTSTTVVNAYLRKPCRAYLRDLATAARRVDVLTSAGGLVPAAEAAEVPARLLLSGPAGGVRAAAAAAAAAGFPDAISFDMGGTSTDVCLILSGLPAPAPQRTVAGFPVRLPSLDIHTIGAGGGSIAALDPGGALLVGPRSAGAEPGPACYGRGGTEPTVTDADLVLGRLPTELPLGPLGRLDVEAARRALVGAGVDPEGVVAVVDAAMVEALRAVSVARGVDPWTLALVAFGGAGPLHACSLADALGLRAVVVPARAGVLSAVGVLTSPDQRDLVRSWPHPDDPTGLDAARAELAAEAAALLAGAGGGGNAGAGGDEDVEVTTAVDCRYRGQAHELTVPSIDAFHAEHERRNGYRRDDAPVEVIAVRATAWRPSPVRWEDLPAPERSPVVGPAVVAEPDCTVWVPAGWAGRVAPGGALVLERAGEGAA